MNIETRVARVLECRNCKELAIGFLRYEKLSTLSPREYNELHRRCLAGENFNDMVDDLIEGR